MVWVKTRHVVQRKPFTLGDTDAYGNAVDTWGDPVDVPVFGWAPATPAVGFDQGRRPVATEFDIFAPAETECRDRDLWVLDGLEYKQQGPAEDFTHGPFGFAGGLRVNVKRSDG